MELTNGVGNSFLTGKMGVAAFLIARGFPLLGVVADGTDRYMFAFPATAKETAAMYYTDEGTVNAKEFLSKWMDCRVLLRQAQGGLGPTRKYTD